MLPYQKETDKSTGLTSEQAVRYREKRRVKMVNIQSSCPILMKKFSSLRQKVLNNAKESLRHQIKIVNCSFIYIFVIYKYEFVNYIFIFVDYEYTFLLTLTGFV